MSNFSRQRQNCRTQSSKISKNNINFLVVIFFVRLCFSTNSTLCFDFEFDCAENLCWTLGIDQLDFLFQFCSTYISTFWIETGFVPTVLVLGFDCARPMFRLCSTYVSAFSTYVSTISTCVSIFSTTNGYASTVLDICFDFLIFSSAK